MRTLYLCGASNPEGVRLALRVNEARAGWSRILLLDDDPGRLGQVILGISVVGSFAALARADPATDEVVNLVARTTERRVAAAQRIAAYGVPVAGLVHPGVDVDGSELAPGTIVYPHAWIGPCVSIGTGSVVFMGAVIGHGSRLGADCVVAPNAVLNARVLARERVYIGTNASVLPDVEIGADATVSANSVVLSDVRPGVTMLGVPAKALPLLSRSRVPGLPLSPAGRSESAGVADDRSDADHAPA